jgi:hypothetical protein
MSKPPSNNELMEIDERAPSQNPYNIIPINLFPIVIKDSVIKLNR